MTEARVAPFRCPGCGREHENLGTMGDDGAVRPSPGDNCGCIRCGAALIFDGLGQLRVLTPEEYAALDPQSKANLGKIKAFAMMMSNRMN
jgi:hypothetical protein